MMESWKTKKGKFLVKGQLKKGKRTEKENWEIYGKISFTDTSRRVKIKLKLCDFSLQHNSKMITRKRIFILGNNHAIKLITSWKIKRK